MTDNKKITSQYYFWGPLLFVTELEEHQLNQIQKLCNKENPNARKTLAGHIENEHVMDPAALELIIKPQFEMFYDAYQMYYDRPCQQQVITSSWVNFMKRAEFNPPHVHGEHGREVFSGIIFLQIPEGLKKEQEEFEGNSHLPGSLDFRLFQNLDDNLISHRGFVPKRGQFFMFPSSLEHMVYPFKAEGERISVAFNTIKRYS